MKFPRLFFMHRHIYDTILFTFEGEVFVTVVGRCYDCERVRAFTVEKEYLERLSRNIEA